jgi:hypothetical protein
VAQGEGEHGAVAAAVELEESEVFDQTCFAAVEVAAAANPLHTKSHTTDVIHTSLHRITCRAIQNRGRN